MSEEKKKGFIDKIGLANLLNLEEIARIDRAKERKNKEENKEK